VLFANNLQFIEADQAVMVTKVGNYNEWYCDKFCLRPDNETLL